MRVCSSFSEGIFIQNRFCQTESQQTNLYSSFASALPPAPKSTPTHLISPSQYHYKYLHSALHTSVRHYNLLILWGGCSSCKPPHNKMLPCQLLSHVQLFGTPWTAAHQASLSFTIAWSLLKLMSIESVMLSNHLILSHPLLLPSIFPSIRVFSNDLAHCITCSKYQSFSISPSNEC